MTREEFEKIVADCLERLPTGFRERLDNVTIEVEDWPDPETLLRAGVGDRRWLQGFYHGVPLSRRGRGYHLAAPDRISIYRRPILASCRGRQDVRERICHVLYHELAHHFGIDDSRLHEIGAY